MNSLIEEVIDQSKGEEDVEDCLERVARNIPDCSLVTELLLDSHPRNKRVNEGSRCSVKKPSVIEKNERVTSLEESCWWLGRWTWDSLTKFYFRIWQ